MVARPFAADEVEYERFVRQSETEPVQFGYAKKIGLVVLYVAAESVSVVACASPLALWAQRGKNGRGWESLSAASEGGWPGQSTGGGS